MRSAVRCHQMIRSTRAASVANSKVEEDVSQGLVADQPERSSTSSAQAAAGQQVFGEHLRDTQYADEASRDEFANGVGRLHE